METTKKITLESIMKAEQEVQEGRIRIMQRLIDTLDKLEKHFDEMEKALK
jgi:hypothetical protein